MFNVSNGGSGPLQILGSGNNNLLTVTQDGEVIVTDTAQEYNVYAAYSRQNVTGQQWGMLVDKTATGVWPHLYTGRLDVSFLSLQCDKPSGVYGSVSVGVVTQLFPTSGQVIFFGGLNFTSSTDTHLFRSENFAPSQIKCGVGLTGNTPMMIGTRTVALSGLNSLTLLDSVLGSGTVFPSTGDLVMRFDRTSGVGGYTASARVLYHSHPFAP